MSYALKYSGLFLLLACHTACAQPGVPVSVGGSIHVDACEAVGQVNGLKSEGNNLLSVRSGPGESFRVMDKVPNGQLVYVCDHSRNDQWLGVVYGPDEGDCGVASPIAERRSYAGPCKAGWVNAQWVEIVAG